MLHVFGLDSTAVVVGDVFFVDPHPARGLEGAESGVRVELRRLTRLPLRGSVYSSQPIALDAPILRVDLFETFPDGRGTADRVHHHPGFHRWDPGPRQFDPALSADPLGWLRMLLVSADGLPPEVGDADRRAARSLADGIVETVERLWATVRHGDLDPPPGWTDAPSYRRGWL